MEQRPDIHREPPLSERDSAALDELRPGLADLAPAAAERIRLFLAGWALRGGASPAEIAALYTAPEIVADPLATRYLDRRFVDQEPLADWRSLLDRISSVLPGLSVSATAVEVLVAMDAAEALDQPQRSIFDDPDDEDIERAQRLTDRNPTLLDLTDEARAGIERLIVREILEHGLPPIRFMELREHLLAIGDERALQYLDLAFEEGRLPDWEALRDRALVVRKRFDQTQQDVVTVLLELEALHPGADAETLLRLLEARLD